MQFGRGQRILFQAERANETQNTSLTGNLRAVVFDGDTTSNLEFSNVQLGNGFRTIRTRYSKGNGGDATLTVHRGSPDTPAIATVQLPNTGSDNTFRARNATFPVNENDASPIFFRVGGDGVANIDWIDFINQPPTVSFDAGDSDVQVRAGIFNRGNGQLNVDINGEPSFIRFNNTSLSYKPTVRVRYALGD